MTCLRNLTLGHGIVVAVPLYLLLLWAFPL